MAKFQPIKCTEAQMNSKTKSEGQLFFTTDTNKIYLDISNTSRMEYCSINTPTYPINLKKNTQILSNPSTNINLGNLTNINSRINILYNSIYQDKEEMDLGRQWINMNVNPNNPLKLRAFLSSAYSNRNWSFYQDFEWDGSYYYSIPHMMPVLGGNSRLNFQTQYIRFAAYTTGSSGMMTKGVSIMPVYYDLYSSEGIYPITSQNVRLSILVRENHYNVKSI